MGIRLKLSLWFVVLTLLPTFFVGAYLYFSAEKLLHQSFLRQLESTAGIQEQRLQSILQSYEVLTKLIAKRPRLLSALDLQGTPPDPNVVSTLLLESQINRPDTIRDILFFDSERRFVASATNHTRQESLPELLSKKDDESVCVLLIDRFEEEYTVHMATPVMTADSLVGYLVISFASDELTALTNAPLGLGETGETVLLASPTEGEYRYLSPPLFRPELFFHQKSISDATDMGAVSAMSGVEQTFFRKFRDYRGVEVYAATRTHDAKKFRFGLVVKADRGDALAPVEKLGSLFGIILLFVGVLAAVVGVAFYEFLVRPIMKPSLRSEQDKGMIFGKIIS